MSCSLFRSQEAPQQIWESHDRLHIAAQNDHTKGARISIPNLGNEVRQGCILSPCLFNLYAEYIMRNAGLEETQAGIKIAGRNINNLRYADDTTLMAESEGELRAS